MLRKWKKGSHVDPQREKLKEELFTFKKTVEHGFPHHPCAFAYDPILKVLAIGTKNGAIKVFGAPGVEFAGIHSDVNQVLQLHFLHGQGRLVSILDDNTLHMWEFSFSETNNSLQTLVEVGASQLGGRPGINQITEVCVRSTNDLMWVGTEGGAIYSISLPDFEPNNVATIHQDQVMQSIPDHYKSGKALGPVEAITEHPTDSSLILIGYSRGLVVLWNDKTQSVDKYYLNEKALESISWRSNCKEFISAHIDGSLCTWRLESSSPHTSYIPYGPFPCKAVTKILWKTSRADTFYIFSGGMPRANYGDRHCISVIRGSKHVTFDFTSRVIDFFVICKNKPSAESEDPQNLIVLAEEELIAIDLTKDDWPSFAPPYLASPHASAITCSTCAENISDNVWKQIKEAAHSKSQSVPDWPVNGGTDMSGETPRSHNLLITGHEDGSVKLWDVSGVSMSPILKVSTSSVFLTDSESNGDCYEEQFPPFRKVGEFDPYSDDPRLAIRKVAICLETGTLVAGGTAGQVVVMILSSESIESVVVNNDVDILEGRTAFTWKGHDRLQINDSHIVMKPGYQISNVVQCQPPASVSSISVNANWGLVGFGTGHGFVLFDYIQKLQEANAALVDEEETASASGWSPPATGHRRIEARSAEDGMTGTVRCIYFASTYIRDTVSSSPTFWAGTNSGAVYVFALHVPDYSMRQESEVTSILGKHIQLMHRAPVIDISVVDGRGIPLQAARLKSGGQPLNGRADKNSPAGGAQHHSLVVSSEEQLKVFSLPKISSKRKYKLTALDGSLVRRVVFARFASSRNPDYQEYGLVCLTNLGEIHIIGQLPSLRSQEIYSCIARDDAYGLASAILTSEGQGFYLLSPSEYSRFSLSTCGVIEPMCNVRPPSDERNSFVRNNVSVASMRAVVEDGPKNTLEAESKKSPTKSSRSPSIGHAVVASIPHSPKTPLLAGDDDDNITDDDDDQRHMELHESVLQEAERTLAEAAAGDLTSSLDVEAEDIDVQKLLGVVVEAEKLLNEGK